ncbi:potassium channel family protein [Porticoccus sp.]
MLIPPLFDTGSNLVSRLSWVAVLLMGLWLVNAKRRLFIIGCLLALPAIVIAWQPLPIDLNALTLSYIVLSVLFLLFILGNLLYFVVQMKRVTGDLIFAALCTYLLIGVLWGHFFLMMHILIPQAFSSAVSGDWPYPQALREFIYFSFVTLSTLGYGDITPVSPVSRSWAMVEAVIGQFYLAIVVARLLGLYISKESSRSQ